MFKLGMLRQHQHQGPLPLRWRAGEWVPTPDNKFEWGPEGAKVVLGKAETLSGRLDLPPKSGLNDSDWLRDSDIMS